MNHVLGVRRFAAGDAPAAVAIIRGLPDYFTDDVPAKVERDAVSHEAWVVTGRLAGYVVTPGVARLVAEQLAGAVDR